MKIVTISREYGAGGHSIGRKVAEELGVPFYDDEILLATAEAAGLDVSMVAATEEGSSKTDAFLRSIIPISYDQKDTIFDIQSKIINDLADKGPCVILGRCSDHILRNAGKDIISVFIYADDVHRAFRVGELHNTANATEIQKIMKKYDSSRHAYYARYTGKRWDDCHNYTMAIDSGLLGYDTCIKLICDAAKNS